MKGDFFKTFYSSFIVKIPLKDISVVLFDSPLYFQTSFENFFLAISLCTI